MIFNYNIKKHYKLLKKGIFRLVVPDLEIEARNYLDRLNRKDSMASISFMENTLLGKIKTKKSKSIYNLFLWEFKSFMDVGLLSLSKELKEIGFLKIRACKFNDSEDKLFNLVENSSRFINSVAIECRNSLKIFKTIINAKSKIYKPYFKHF